ncbi:MAG: putative manganese transporter [Pseudomonadota bacterium]
MTDWILEKINSASIGPVTRRNLFSNANSIFILAGAALFLALLGSVWPEFSNLVIKTLSDAYLGVTIFVALTLAVFYALDFCFKRELTASISKKSPLQIPLSALLGALPGCGGAIIVVTQFVNGRLSFGALVAVLIATMGDAAFLLLAKQPHVAMQVYGISLCAGVVSGFIVNIIFGDDYLKPTDTTQLDAIEVEKIPTAMISLFFLMLVPGSVVGIFEALQIDTSDWFAPWGAFSVGEAMGFFGALICISIWLKQPLDSWSIRFRRKSESDSLLESVAAETSFVSIWVIAGFLLYEMFLFFTNLQLESLFNQWGAVIVLISILVGFIPGCGPQIVVTTLYVNGVVPLSVQVANAISNDGDALFPAIALAPEAAIKATLISAVPAAIVGYIFYFAGA